MKRIPTWRLIGVSALLLAVSGCDSTPSLSPSFSPNPHVQAIEIAKLYFVESTAPKYDRRCLSLAAYPATSAPALGCLDQMKKIISIATELLPLDGKLEAYQSSINYDLREIFTDVAEMRKIKLDTCTKSRDLCVAALANFKRLKMRVDFQMISIRQ